MIRPGPRTALLLIGSILFAVIAAEIILRAFIEISPGASGVLLGRPLPPLKLIPDDYVYRDLADQVVPETVVVRGRRVTGRDLAGAHRTDSLLGYAPKENTRSPMSWWQTNNVGARLRDSVAREVPPGKVRVLVFGESYAAGSRLPQDESWSSQLSRRVPDLELLNFAVDGYGMAQSYLRYTQVREQLDYDIVLLMFLPTQDLWRDVNTMRALVGWEVYQVMPRYVLAGDRLVLVRSPYARYEDLLQRNRPRLSPELRRHLEMYDRLYRPRLYELDTPLAHSVLFRLFVSGVERREIARTLDDAKRADSEAMRVSVEIFRRMRADVEARGKRFVLVVMPSEGGMGLYRPGGEYRANWDRMAAAACTGQSRCLDLMGFLAQVPPDSIDRGYTNDHYGPRMSLLIAEYLRAQLFSDSAPGRRAAP